MDSSDDVERLITYNNQNWSTYVTMKVIVNQENREKYEIVMILNDFHCDISTSILI